jgi:hypothetical protein
MDEATQTILSEKKTRIERAKMKVYFFPGLGADASLSRYHNLPGHDVEWVNWPKNIPNSWGQFDNDLLNETNIENGSVFIGISFGGMVAQGGVRDSV